MMLLSWLAYPFILVSSFLTGVIPPRVNYALMHVMGGLAYTLLSNRRRVLAANLAPVMGKPAGDPALQRAGRSSFRNYARYLYEFLRFPHLSVDQIDRRVILHVSDDFRAARALGKGVIFVSMHFGNMDLTGVAVSKHVVPLTVVGDLVPPQALMDKLVDFRQRKGVRLVYGARAPRAILSALKRNEAVGFLVDVGHRRDNGIPVTFFGQRTMFPSGPALLALRTGAPIIPGYGIVCDDNRIHGFSYPPIFVQPTGDKQRDVHECSQRIAACFEDFISRFPEQWYIYRPMWAAGAWQTSGSNPQQEVVPEGA